MKLQFPTLLALICVISAATTRPCDAQTTVDFESLPVPTAGFFNGDTEAGSPYRDNFTITDSGGTPVEYRQLWNTNGLQFFNAYTPDWLSWRGFSWSNVVDTTTAGFTNQYASFPGGGSNGAGNLPADGENYIVAFNNNTFFNLPEPSLLNSVDLTNTTYAGISMRDGDSFAKKFGGATGDDPDYFKVTFTGYDDVGMQGNTTGTIDYYLADFRFSDNSMDYIVDEWENLDLSGLGSIRSVGLSFETTDVGEFGPNTPFYVAIDNVSFTVTPVPEPSTLVGIGLVGCLSVLRRKRTPK